MEGNGRGKGKKEKGRRGVGEGKGRRGGRERMRWEGICRTIVKLLPIRACERLHGKGLLPIRMHKYLLKRSIRYEQP